MHAKPRSGGRWEVFGKVDAKGLYPHRSGGEQKHVIGTVAGEEG